MDPSQEDTRRMERKTQRAPHRRERKGKLFKRSREQLEQTSEQRLLRVLLDFSQENQEPFDGRLEIATSRIQEFLDDEKFFESIIDCILELPSRTSHYAYLIGALRLECGELVESLLIKVCNEFSIALNQSSLLQARLLLRFLCALVPVRVVSPLLVIQKMNLIVDQSLNILMSRQDNSGRSWQPWADNLVYIVLIALPWGGEVLMGDHLEERNRLFQKIETYVTQRPIQKDVSLSPFLAPIKENDNPAKSDSGGASFLSELWTAVRTQHSLGQWQLQSIPNVSDTLREKFGNSLPLAVPEFDIPTTPPGWNETTSISERASILNKKYPPRGGIHLLDDQHTHPDSSELEKIIVEEYILDLLWIYQGSRVDCVRRITLQIPSPFPIFALVAQTLFSQLLMLPKPPLLPVTYAAIIINLCKIPDEAWSVFPRGLSACVREIFSRLSVLDTELNNRMMDWLSLHLSNLSFMWPWSKWKKVVEAPPYNSQRLFVQGVLRRLVDLSYLAKVKESLTAEEFHSLLPPEGKVRTLEDIFEMNKDEDRMEVDEFNHSKESVEQLTKMQEMVKRKASVEEIRSAYSSWLSMANKETLYGFFCILLSTGNKNMTHAESTITRYLDILNELSTAVGEQRQEVMVGAVLEVWKNSIHRSCLILNYLLCEGFIQTSFFIPFIFHKLDRCHEEESVQYWELLKIVLSFSETIVKKAEKERMDAVARVQHAKESARDAAKRAADAAELVETGDSVRISEMLDAINEANQSEAKAQQQVAEAEAQLHAANADQMIEANKSFSEILIKIYQGFAELLRSEPGPDCESEDMKRIYYRNLMAFGSFTCQFSENSTSLLNQLQEIFAENRVPRIVRRVLASALRLGIDENDHEVIYDISFFSKK